MDPGTVLGVQTHHAVSFAAALPTPKAPNTSLLIADVEAMLLIVLKC